METKEFVRWFLLAKLLRKFHQVALTIFVGTILGQIPSPWGIIGFTLFFLSYLNTYIYNDLMDYEDDRSKGSVYKEKILARGYASKKEFIVLLGNLSILSIFLTTLWDPLLGFFTVSAILLNNLRTHVKDLLARQVLLMFVELFNFEAFWNAFFGGSIPAIFILLFVAYASLYALGHGIYRMRKKGTLTKIMRTRELRNLLILSVVSIIFSLPALFISTYHFAFLVLGLLIYILPMLRVAEHGRLDDQRSMEKVTINHTLTVTLVGIVLLAGALLYIFYGSPLNVYIPFIEYNGYYLQTSHYFDQLQDYILRQMFGSVRGLRSSYDKNISDIPQTT